MSQRRRGAAESGVGAGWGRRAAPSGIHQLTNSSPPSSRPGSPASLRPVHPLDRRPAHGTDAPGARFATNERHRPPYYRNGSEIRNHPFRSFPLLLVRPPVSRPTPSPCSVVFITSWNVPATILQAGTFFGGRVTVTPTTGNACCSYRISARRGTGFWSS